MTPDERLRDRNPGEPLRKYWLRMMAIAPDGAVIRIDEPNDRLEVVEWPDDTET